MNTHFQSNEEGLCKQTFPDLRECALCRQRKLYIQKDKANSYEVKYIFVFRAFICFKRMLLLALYAKSTRFAREHAVHCHRQYFDKSGDGEGRRDAWK